MSATAPQPTFEPLCPQADDIIVWANEDRTWCFREELNGYLSFMPETFTVLASGSPAWHRHGAHRAR